MVSRDAGPPSLETPVAFPAAKRAEGHREAVVAAVLWGNVQEAVDQAIGAPEGLLEPVAHIIDLTSERPVAIGHRAEGATGG